MAKPLLDEIWRALGGDSAALARVSFSNTAFALPSAFPVSELAAATVAAAGLALSEYVKAARESLPPERPTDAESAHPTVDVDQRLASLWFGTSIRPDGWTPPSIWDALAGDYVAAKGAWIRLHTNAPHHRDAALAALGLSQTASREDVATAVRTWDANDLEAAVVAAGGCAAAMRSVAAWAAHPQGAAVALEPLVCVTSSVLFVPSDAMDRRGPGRAGPPPEAEPPGAPEGSLVHDTSAGAAPPELSPAPLRGVRVLDLTRIIAGPVATRTLAGWGAEVLRIDPEGWEEGGTLPDTTLGKRCARLDLKSPAGLATLRRLLAGADVLVHGYRPGALDALPGFGPSERAALRPGLVEVSLSAYGGDSVVGNRRGPWAARRGFDSLVQMSCGIADAGRAWAAASGGGGGDSRDTDGAAPVPLPVQALDHATGYIVAAAALRGLALRTAAGQRASWSSNRGGGGGVAAFAASTSLARVAALLVGAAAEGLGAAACAPASQLPADADFDTARLEETAWGPGLRLRPPVSVRGYPLVWPRPACRLGSSVAEWSLLA